jgi:hypothetical protein
MTPACFSRLVSALILVVALASTSCSAYSNPTADLVLHVADADAGNRVVAAIGQFARDRKLTAYPASNDSPAPEYIRQLKEKTTYYLTGTRYGKGRSLTFFDASPDCKVVRVVERSEHWLKESEADLAALRAALSALAGVTVNEGARFDGEGPGGRSLNEYCPATSDISSQTPAA